MGSDPAQLEELVGMEASVYGIWDKRNPDECLYTGSTTKPVCVRFAEHLLSAYYSRSIRRASTPFHEYMDDEGVSNFEARLLEKCNKEIRKQREQFHMDRLKPKFNRMRAYGLKMPTSTSPLSLRKRYPYRQTEKGRNTRRAWLARNKEAHSEARRKRYNEIGKVKQAEKVLCSCGLMLARSSMYLHVRSRKHLSLSTVKRGSL